ncbi:MAG: hypothetical protein KF901_09930 [Myxococcales bacterium]|nr:hypothetical protein [Myxococcales bacterium]
MRRGAGNPKADCVSPWALAARAEARFPVTVTYLVHRDIVSYGGPPDPCRIDERAFGVSY